MIPTTRPRDPGASATVHRGPGDLPPELLADPGLGPTAKLIAAVLVQFWARFKDHCWPSDRTIAARIGRSPGHVQRCLRQLEQAGWIRREATIEVPSGRRIWLCWRLNTPGAGARGGPAPAREGVPAPARSKQVVVGTREEELPEPESRRERPRPEPTITAPAPIPTPTLAAALATVLGSWGRLTAQEACPESPVPPSDVPAPWAPALPSRAPKQPGPTSHQQPPACLPDDVSGSKVPESRPQPESPASPTPSLPAPWSAPTPDSLVGLTPSEQARLKELPEATRQKVLEWLALKDPICLGEAKRLLRPPLAIGAPPATTAELLARIREDPTYPAQAAERLAREFDDRRSWSGFHALCQRAWRGELPAAVLVAAYHQASGPRARNPGALLHAVVRRHDRSA